jgi:hypothetical protein
VKGLQLGLERGLVEVGVGGRSHVQTVLKTVFDSMSFLLGVNLDPGVNLAPRVELCFLVLIINPFILPQG